MKTVTPNVLAPTSGENPCVVSAKSTTDYSPTQILDDVNPVLDLVDPTSLNVKDFSKILSHMLNVLFQQEQLHLILWVSRGILR